MMIKSAYVPTNNNNEKTYVPLELIKLPLFLQQKSKKVLDSRIGHQAYLKRHKLEKEGFTEEEIAKQTVYEADSTTFKKTYKDLGWTISAHQDFGLPDHFDGIVWSCFEDMISDSSIHSEDTLFYYQFTEAQLVKMVLNKSGMKKSGKFQQRLRESVRRLKRTGYILHEQTDNGFISYEFNLLSEVYEKGERDQNGDISSTWVVGIDPRIIFNMRSNKYMISHTEERNRLSNYESIALYDYLSYLFYIDMKEGRHEYALAANIQPNRVISYEKICDVLGITYLTGNMLKPARIKSQLKKCHEELVAAEMLDSLDSVIVEKNNITNNSYNLIYLFSDKFYKRKQEILSVQLSIEFDNDRVKKYVNGLMNKVSKKSLSLMNHDSNLSEEIKKSVQESIDKMENDMKSDLSGTE